VVVQEQERKQRLARAARQNWIAAAPVIIVVGADYEMADMAWRWDADHCWDLFPIQTTAVAIQTFMLAAYCVFGRYAEPNKQMKTKVCLDPRHTNVPQWCKSSETPPTENRPSGPAQRPSNPPPFEHPANEVNQGYYRPEDKHQHK